MEQFNLQATTKSLLREFTTCTETQDILYWFNKAKNYKIIFEDKDISRDLYNRLILSGYCEINSPLEELECLKQLMKKDLSTDEKKIGNMLISLILKSLKNAQALSSALEQLLAIYNETYNKELIFSQMMNNLQDAVGESVTFIIIENQEPILKTGTINRVQNYEYVIIDNEKIPFIGYGIEINKITTNYGKMLYNNSRASISDNLTDSEEISRKRTELFGYIYKGAPKLV